MRLLIMGPPGAGKGTQAAVVGEHYGIPAISTGNIFRVAITNRTPLGERIKRIISEGFFQLEYAFNTGSAFGFLRSAAWSRAFFIVITLAAVAYMVRLALTLPTRFLSAYFAVAMIVGGALGNLYDRVLRFDPNYKRHGVVDFLVFYYWPDKRWPAFNVADVALVAGVILFMLFLRKHGAAIDRAVTAKARSGDA